MRFEPIITILGALVANAAPLPLINIFQPINSFQPLISLSTIQPYKPSTFQPIPQIQPIKPPSIAISMRPISFFIHSSPVPLKWRGRDFSTSTIVLSNPLGPIPMSRCLGQMDPIRPSNYVPPNLSVISGPTGTIGKNWIPDSPTCNPNKQQCTYHTS